MCWRSSVWRFTRQTRETCFMARKNLFTKIVRSSVMSRTSAFSLKPSGMKDRTTWNWDSQQETPGRTNTHKHLTLKGRRGFILVQEIAECNIKTHKRLKHGRKLLDVWRHIDECNTLKKNSNDVDYSYISMIFKNSWHKHINK